MVFKLHQQLIFWHNSNIVDAANFFRRKSNIGLHNFPGWHQTNWCIWEQPLQFCQTSRINYYTKFRWRYCVPGTLLHKISKYQFQLQSKIRLTVIHPEQYEESKIRLECSGDSLIFRNACFKLPSFSFNINNFILPILLLVIVSITDRVMIMGLLQPIPRKG